MSAVQKCDECGSIATKSAPAGWIHTGRIPPKTTIGVSNANSFVTEIDLSYLDFCSAQCFNNYMNKHLEEAGANETKYSAGIKMDG